MAISPGLTKATGNYLSLHPKPAGENVAALEMKLTAEDLRRIEEIFPTGAAAGERYPEHMMKIVNG